MELRDINPEEKIVLQHNAITSGRYDFSACMLDILFMVLAGLENNKREYTIHAGDIEKITGRKWNYQQLREATETIGSRMFEIQTSEKLTQLWLFSSVEYNLGKGSFTIVINEKAMPYFFELKNNFTSLQLKSVLGCSSKYAKRLYGISCQWRSVGVKRFEILELKNMLGLVDRKGNEQYAEITAFKKKVLDIAKEQINAHTDISFDYELTKRGRSFHWITLYFEQQRFKQLTIDFDMPIENQKLKTNLMAYGLNEEQAGIISTTLKISEFDEIIADLNYQMRQRKVKADNMVGYLVGVFQNKGILPRKKNNI